MDPANRPVDWDLRVFALNTTINILEVFTNVEISITSTTMMAEATKDSSDTTASWDTPRIKDRDWSITTTSRVETPAAGTDAVHGIFDAPFALSEDVAYPIVLSGPSDGATGDIFSVTGYVKISGGDLNFPGEAADQGLTMEGYGAPTVAIGALA